MSAFLVLLSTDHCALCDEALSMLFSMPELAGLELRVSDVAQDDDLLERFGERVPVLQLFTEAVAEQNRPTLEMSWPFTPESVTAALARVSG